MNSMQKPGLIQFRDNIDMVPQQVSFNHVYKQKIGKTNEHKITVRFVPSSLYCHSKLTCSHFMSRWVTISTQYLHVLADFRLQSVSNEMPTASSCESLNKEKVCTPSELDDWSWYSISIIHMPFSAFNWKSETLHGNLYACIYLDISVNHLHHVVKDMPSLQSK